MYNVEKTGGEQVKQNNSEDAHTADDSTYVGFNGKKAKKYLDFESRIEVSNMQRTSKHWWWLH